MTLPVQLQIDPVGTLDGRIVLSLIDLLRTARDQVHAGTLTIGDVLRADAPIITDTLRRYGLGDNDAYLLYDTTAYFISKIAQRMIFGFPAGADLTDAFLLGTLSRDDAYNLLASACGQVNATLAAY